MGTETDVIETVRGQEAARDDNYKERDRTIRLTLDFRCYSKEWQARETCAEAIRILQVNGFKFNYQLEEGDLVVGKAGANRPTVDQEFILNVTQ